jgi:hypothetical protein
MPVVLMHYGWGMDHLTRTFSQFIEAVQNIQAQTLGFDTPEKHKAGYILDLLRISIDNIDNVVEFLHFKMVSSLVERSIFTINLYSFKG